MVNDSSKLIGGFSHKVSNSVNFYYGVVVDISTDGDKKIKVRIKGIDDKLTNEELSWCAPYLPIFLTFTPKVGEMVKIIPQSNDDIYVNREWIGSIIVNDLNIDFQVQSTALANQKNSSLRETLKTKLIEDYENIYPQKDVISLQGRGNSDLILGDKYIELRAGKHLVKNKTKLNKLNPSSIKLSIDDNGSTSYTTVTSDKILLISNNDEYSSIIDKNELEKIINTAMSATYAEPLIEFMNLMKDFVANHIHVSNLPPNKGVGAVRDILNFDVSSVKAPNIKIK